MFFHKRFAHLVLGMVLASSTGLLAQERTESVSRSASSAGRSPLPFSDPTNSGNWVLREDISDEFDGDKIDSSKWFVEGQSGDYYIWKGRAPSQFAPHNVIVEDGKLKIRSQWEPDFEFAKDEGHEGNTYRTHDGKDIPVTTGAVVSRKRFLNGYMEVQSKAGNAAMTAAFWGIGYESELDIFEQMGNPNAGNDIQEDSTKCSVHDWQPPAKRPTRKFGYKKKLPFRVADDFHVYGCEWGKDYLKCYIDGELVYETTQEKEGKNWVLTNPLEIWLDSEIFVWLGLPYKEELPVDFEIEYMRVWQQPQSNLLERAFHGFEGPYLFQDNPRPLELVPESSEENEYQKFWRIGGEDAKALSVVRHETCVSGTRSLKFEHRGKLTGDGVFAEGPAGSVALPAGQYEFSADVWIDPKSDVGSIAFSLQDPVQVLALVQTADLAKGKWVTVRQRFHRGTESTAQDRIRIAIGGSDVGDGEHLVFVDDLSVRRVD